LNSRGIGSDGMNKNRITWITIDLAEACEK
jgi:hypothetical protein